MSDYENLMNKLLELKPELSRSEIEERVSQKKEKIGAGYLTDQGAIFLIASELGVSLTEPLKVEMGLKDLYVGAKEVSLETRVLNVSPTKQYTRKDGSPLLLRTMTVYDKNSTASVKLWDEKANIPEIEKLKPGDLIRIIKAYVKSDLNGNPTVNVGSNSSLEISNKASDIPSIDDITVDVSEIKENQRDLVIEGKIDGMIASSTFTNPRGTSNTALRFRLRGKDGKTVRVVLWGKSESDIPSIVSPNAKLRLLGVRTKFGTQELEVHGNQATIIEIEGKQEVKLLTLRIISATKREDGRAYLVCSDNKKRLFNMVCSTINSLSFSEGDVIECMPSKVLGTSVVIDENSVVRKIEDDLSIPSKADLRTKIADVKIGETYCVEAIILKIPGRREVQTKTGETVLLSEMFVEDDSGQIWIKGWRDQARLIDTCSLGEIISVTAVNARAGLEGRTELFLTSFSTITKKN